MRVLITAGPTREPIDSVRYISNRSSGRMGLALARAAAQAGHEVTLLLGPVGAEEKPNPTIVVYRFESSAELEQLLDVHFADSQLLIMAAAVCDYRSVWVTDGKLSSDKKEGMTLTLAPTPDLVAAMAARRRAGQRVVAFALEEPEHLHERALVKMKRKQVDAIVANPLETMDSPTICPTLYWADGRCLSPGSLAKTEFARWLIEQLAV